MTGRQRTTNAFILLVIALVIAAGLTWFARIASAPPLAPGFSLVDTQGTIHRLRDYRGQVLIVNFWAGWCAPCRHEMPMLDRLAREWRRRGVRVVGVAVDDPGATRRYLGAHPVGYPILLGAHADALQSRYVGARDPDGVLPYTAIVNRSGHIVWRTAGQMSRRALERAVRHILARSDAESRPNTTTQRS